MLSNVNEWARKEDEDQEMTEAAGGCLIKLLENDSSSIFLEVCFLNHLISISSTGLEILFADTFIV